VEVLTKEKKEKEKENVFIDLELMNLNNASLLNYKKLKKKDSRGRKKEVGGGK
jgi:hypothetical protein